ncbi:MAG TPA: PilZ domain-containing protein [Terriglobia bacterium]|nr:PilZ domain-containing protein [Terriglobia bacterium]
MSPNLVPPLRRSTRVRVRIPVIITGVLPDGTAFTEETYVLSVSRFGAKLKTGYSLQPGMEIRLRSKARPEDALFHVVWAGQEGTFRTGEVGVQYVKVSNFLGVAFPE